MKQKSVKVTSKCSFGAIRIYINDILHIRYPKSKSIRIQSWVDGDRKPKYKIEIRCKDWHDEYHYENRTTWESVLKLLDESI